jgi:PAS domain S-box-containing protein
MICKEVTAMRPIQVDSLLLQLSAIYGSNLPNYQKIQDSLSTLQTHHVLLHCGLFVIYPGDMPLAFPNQMNQIYPIVEEQLLIQNNDICSTKQFQKDDIDYFMIGIEKHVVILFGKKNGDYEHFVTSDYLQFLINTFRGLLHQLFHDRLDRFNHENATLLNTIINSMPDLIAYKDVNGIYKMTNKKADETFSSRFETIIGKSIDEVYPPKEATVVKNLDKEALASKEPIQKEISLLTEQGYIYADTTRIRVDNELGEPVGVISISRDLTDFVKTRDQLSRSKQFQDILMSIATKFINVPLSLADEAIQEALQMTGSVIKADRIYVFDYDFELKKMDNTYEWCSQNTTPYIKELQDVPMDEFMDVWVNPHTLGQSVYFPNVNSLSKESAIYGILSMQGIQSVLTIPLMNTDGCLGFVGFDAVKEPLYWSNEDQKLLKVLAELLVNLKMRKVSMHELTMATKKAEDASHAKGDFLANMSHEIRTPLSGVYNSLYLLLNTELSSEQQEFLDIAKTSIESLSGIVNNILDFSKIEAGKLELDPSAFDLEDELFQIAKMQEYSALEKGLRVFLDYDYTLPVFVYFDRLRLRQVLMNLLHNAVKYTENGYVSLQVRNIETSLDSVELYFGVHDTGIGISSDQVERITDKFYQGDSTATKKHSGTGLGLSIVRQLIELFGGKLDIKSELGKGSIFSFKITLPIEQRPFVERFPLFKNKRAVFINPLDGFGEAPIRFMESMGLEVEIKFELLPQIEQEPPYDFIFFEQDFSECKRSMVQLAREYFGHQQSKVVLCNTSLHPISEKELIDKEIDFAFVMPITRQKVYQSMTKGASSRVLQLKANHNEWDVANLYTGQRVLVVDDNRINRQSLEIILKRAGFAVEIAYNGYEAIDKASIQPFELILMDIQMPGIDGFETTRIIRKTKGFNQYVPILAVTANALPSTKENAILAGMNDTITKPIKIDLLFQAVEKYIASNLDYTNRPHVIFIPKRFLVFNEAEFYARFEGMDDLSSVIMRTFMKEYPGDYQKIQIAIQHQTFEEIKKAAHYFKGSCAYVGADRGAYICQELVDKSKSSDVSTIKELANVLYEELKHWEAEVRNTGNFKFD